MANRDGPVLATAVIDGAVQSTPGYFEPRQTAMVIEMVRAVDTPVLPRSPPLPVFRARVCHPSTLFVKAVHYAT